MFLYSLTIKNYRSLEDVQLDRFGRFNVLIGRNNSGKSSVFGALQLLNTVLRGGSVEPNRVLTDLDQARLLKITAVFQPRPQDREEYIDLICGDGPQANRRREMLDSSLLRLVSFHFESPQGQSHILHLYETKVLTEDNEWATIQRVDDPTMSNPNSTIVRLDALRNHTNAVALNRTVLDVETANQTNITYTGGMDVRNEMVNAMASQDAGTWPTYVSPNTWPQVRLARYVGHAFFFDPFRHSKESLESQEAYQLAQDGSNLAQVLFTLRNNDDLQFGRIEGFVQNALPDIGKLVV
jgi:energy-coupling factor transporter ATP-binding protein EcfA2